MLQRNCFREKKLEMWENMTCLRLENIKWVLFSWLEETILDSTKNVWQDLNDILSVGQQHQRRWNEPVNQQVTNLERPNGIYKFT